MMSSYSSDVKGGGRGGMTPTPTKIPKHRSRSLSSVSCGSLHHGRGCCAGSSLERLSFLRRSGFRSDITITFPGHDVELKAHRIVLAVSSPVFDVMLYGSMAVDNVLSLPEDPPAAFEWILDYLYCDGCDVPGAHIREQVFRLAHKYHMCSLYHLCSQQLQADVTPLNFSSIYDVAVLVEDEEILEKCERVLLMTDRVLSSPDIVKLSRPALRSLLQHHSLTPSSETIVFQAIINWGCQKLKGKAEDDLRKDVISEGDRLSLRQEVEEFLPLVRFLSMTTEEFVVCVVPSNIFTSQECIAILKRIAGIEGPDLPEVASCEYTRKRKSRPAKESHRQSTEASGDPAAKPPLKRLRGSELKRYSSVREKRH
ncbi:BTB/POZ domain-containing protein 6-like [Panulirus ornatus]|uniref:BTB/POZ domain-containing protein 6-like n=1 Tax=Panulirus ornatus TaxID=150431 RepID=UPI003A884BF4